MVKGEHYNQVIIDLEYAEPFKYNLGFYKDKIKEIFEYFSYNHYYKKIDVIFVNEEYFKEDDEDEEE